jgi:hypothetical protein
MKLHYLNTDLDLLSPDDLRPLASTFISHGMYELHASQLRDGVVALGASIAVTIYPHKHLSS